MNRQKIFNTVRDHLLKQGEKAERFDQFHGDVNCVYLAPSGLKCAIGCLIPDGHDAQNYEGGVTNLLHDHPDLVLLWDVEKTGDTDDMRFLSGLQGLHDSNDPDTWSYKLTKFAKREKLTP